MHVTYSTNHSLTHSLTHFDCQLIPVFSECCSFEGDERGVLSAVLVGLLLCVVDGDVLALRVRVRRAHADAELYSSLQGIQNGEKVSALQEKREKPLFHSCKLILL